MKADFYSNMWFRIICFYFFVSVLLPTEVLDQDEEDAPMIFTRGLGKSSQVSGTKSYFRLTRSSPQKRTIPQMKRMSKALKAHNFFSKFSPRLLDSD